MTNERRETVSPPGPIPKVQGQIQGHQCDPSINHPTETGEANQHCFDYQMNASIGDSSMTPRPFQYDDPASCHPAGTTAPVATAVPIRSGVVKTPIVSLTRRTHRTQRPIVIPSDNHHETHVLSPWSATLDSIESIAVVPDDLASTEFTVGIGDGEHVSIHPQEFVVTEFQQHHHAFSAYKKHFPNASGYETLSRTESVSETFEGTTGGDAHGELRGILRKQRDLEADKKNHEKEKAAEVIRMKLDYDDQIQNSRSELRRAIVLFCAGLALAYTIWQVRQGKGSLTLSSFCPRELPEESVPTVSPAPKELGTWEILKDRAHTFFIEGSDAKGKPPKGQNPNTIRTCLFDSVPTIFLFTVSAILHHRAWFGFDCAFFFLALASNKEDWLRALGVSVLLLLLIPCCVGNGATTHLEVVRLRERVTVLQLCLYCAWSMVAVWVAAEQFKQNRMLVLSTEEPDTSM